MRRGLTLLAALLVVAGCQRKAEPSGDLPAQWPIKQLTLPAEALVFEGHVDTQHGGTAVTVFYTASSGWDAQREHVEAKLKPLHYRVMPGGDDEAAGEATPLNHQTWCSPQGDKVVFLSEDPAPPDKAEGGTYFTLLAKQLDEPVKVDPSWPEI